METNFFIQLVHLERWKVLVTDEHELIIRSRIERNRTFTIQNSNKLRRLKNIWCNSYEKLNSAEYLCPPTQFVVCMFDCQLRTFYCLSLIQEFKTSQTWLGPRQLDMLTINQDTWRWRKTFYVLWWIFWWFPLYCQRLAY